MGRYKRKMEPVSEKQAPSTEAATPQLPIVAAEIVSEDEKQLRAVALRTKKTLAERREQLIKNTEPYRWKPGQSGNPGGRSRIEAEMRRLAQENSIAAMQRLIDICIFSDDEACAIAAGRIVMERGFGPVREPPPDDTARGRPNLTNLEVRDLKDLRTILRKVVRAE